jgi:hypothetical protein
MGIHHSRVRWYWLVTLGVCVMVVFGACVLTIKNHHKPVVSAVAVTQQAPTTVPIPRILTSSTMYTGEVFWGRGIEYFANKSPLKYAFPFQGLTVAEKTKYNNWIGDLECSDSTTTVPYQIQVDYLKLNCPPEYLNEVKKWFDAFTMANNHSYDSNGESGLQEGRNHLEAAGIQYFGDYNPERVDDICEVISSKAKITQGTVVKDVSVPVAMCGYMLVVDNAPTANELAVMRKYAKIMPVIAMPHMGVEYRPIAEEQKVQAYHAMIDAGADMVIATHPHVIQNSESYKGRLIVYSTGNFLFDQQSLKVDNAIDMAVGVGLTISDETSIDAYTKVGPSCHTFKDNCLEQLSTLITTRPGISVTYTPECFMEPNYYPKIADDKTCQDILREATWASTVTGLSATW